MKSSFIFTSFVVFVFSLFVSCVVEDADEEPVNESSDISSKSISGFLNSEAYSPKTIHFENSENFDDIGYKFKLFDKVKVCDEFQSIGEIYFFIPSETTLSTGKYSADGPYFNYKDGEDFGTVSFLEGTEVIIESVTDTTITGRVRGGDDNNIHYIEGVFVAELCQK